MKANIFSRFILSGLALFLASEASAQQNETIFADKGLHQSGGYAGISNKFSKINGEWTNMNELYGGWFVNRKLMIGIGGAASTNRISVPSEFLAVPGRRLSYQYGQFGLMTEYVIASTKKVHFNFNLLAGSGFYTQIERNGHDDHFDDLDDFDHRAKFFPLVEPGFQVEFNLLKWMRFSPGVSYRRTFGDNMPELGNRDLSSLSYNLTLKFGKF